MDDLETGPAGNADSGREAVGVHADAVSPESHEKRIERIQQNLKTIESLYKKLEPVINHIHEKYPETHHEDRRKLAQADGLSRLMDLVPNALDCLKGVLALEDIKFTPDLSKYVINTHEIYAQSRALLAQHADDPIVVRADAHQVNFELKKALLDTYERFSVLHTPDVPPHKPGEDGLNPVVVGQLAEKPVGVGRGGKANGGGN